MSKGVNVGEVGSFSTLNSGYVGGSYVCTESLCSGKTCPLETDASESKIKQPNSVSSTLQFLERLLDLLYSSSDYFITITETLTLN